MLQQIIKDMYIEPDLLAELSDEQKQMIFMKIREEQVRRWKEHEDKLEKQMKDKLRIKKPSKKAGAEKTVEFLLGADQNPWVWVMGEHSDDKSIDEILEEEVRKEASKKAETEAELLRAQEEKEAEERLAQEEEKLEQERLKQEQEVAKAAARRIEAEKLAKSKQEAAKAEQDLRRLKSKPTLCKRHSTDGMAIAASATKTTGSGDNSSLTPLTVDTSSGVSSSTADAKTIIVEGEEFDLTSPKARCDIQCQFCFEEKSEKARLTREESYRVLKEKRTTEILSQFQKTKALWEKKAAEDCKKIEQAWEQQEKKAKQAETNLRKLVKAAREDYRRSSVSQNQNDVQRRTPRMSREVFRESAVLLSNVVTAVKPSKSRANRKPRPQNKKEIENWFLEEEKQRRVGTNKSGDVEPWFHGIISREDAEGLLETKPVHSYLVRVSEKIWGYAISYKAEDRCKHYLIDTTENGYQFFGTNQLEHPSLLELIQHHRTHPVSTAGQELLMFPVGQGKGLPDYAPLFPELVETTSL